MERDLHPLEPYLLNRTLHNSFPTYETWLKSRSAWGFGRKEQGYGCGSIENLSDGQLTRLSAAGSPRHDAAEFPDAVFVQAVQGASWVTL